MRKLGIPPENLQPNRYSGPRANLVPCVEAKRRPLVLDRDYPLLSMWRVDFNPSTGSEGEVWQLIKFESNGDATWRRFETSAVGASIMTNTVDDNTGPGVNPVDPDGSGDVAILGGIVANHTVPMETHSRALNAFTIEAQVSTARTGAPANSLDSGMCSFDDGDFTVDANGYVSLVGGVGPAIDNIGVDSFTGPGVNPVDPDGAGLVTVNGAAVAAHSVPIETHSRAVNTYNIEVQVASDRTGAPGNKADAGICSFDDTQFTVDTDGWVTLSGAGLAFDSITVQNIAGTGVNPVVPTALGELTVNGAAVANAAIPVQSISRLPNEYNIEVQVAKALAAAPGDTDEAGLATFDSGEFAVDSDGHVTAISQQWQPVRNGFVRNLGFTLAGGTFSVTSADGSALSATNPAYALLGNKTSPTLYDLYTIESGWDFVDDNGASTIIGNLFGYTTGINWLSNRPFFIYLVANDDGVTLQAMISDNPNASGSVASGNIGTPSSAIADAQGDFWSFDDVTTTEYDRNPCLNIGVVRMQFTGTDDWTVQTLSSKDGVGRYQEESDWQMLAGQFGASSTSTIFSNAGTFPTYNTGATNVLKYRIDRNGWVTCYLNFNQNNASSGAQNLSIALPYEQFQVGGTITYPVLGYWEDASVMKPVRMAITANTRTLTSFKASGTSTILTNSSFASGDALRAEFSYQAFSSNAL